MRGKLLAVSFRIQRVKIPTLTLGPEIAVLNRLERTLSFLVGLAPALIYPSLRIPISLETSRQFYNIQETGSPGSFAVSLFSFP